MSLVRLLPVRNSLDSFLHGNVFPFGIRVAVNSDLGSGEIHSLISRKRNDKVFFNLEMGFVVADRGSDGWFGKTKPVKEGSLKWQLAYGQLLNWELFTLSTVQSYSRMPIES